MKTDREAPVGVFDSGVGGLTVAREIMRNLPSLYGRVARYRPHTKGWRGSSGIRTRSAAFFRNSR